MRMVLGVLILLVSGEVVAESDKFVGKDWEIHDLSFDLDDETIPRFNRRTGNYVDWHQIVVNGTMINKSNKRTRIVYVKFLNSEGKDVHPYLVVEAVVKFRFFKTTKFEAKAPIGMYMYSMIEKVVVTQVK